MATTKQILGKVVITNRGEYNSSTVYEILDVVSYQGSSYLSKVYDNDSLPTDDTKWQLLAQKGDTYEVSETDIENIANQITKNANSNFNRNVSEKTETFNSNAKTKTDEFNSNANNTVSAYNVNAENKLKEYNENDTVKLKKYNDNATSSVDNYNSNAGTKLNEYNTNSVNKLKEYNDNATKAFNNYNSNASTKLNEYNTNSDTKIKEYDEHSEELNTKINSTKNELERVKNGVLETGTGTGNFIHLEDSAMAEMQELEVDGVCEQKTTTGKNKLPNNAKSQTINGIAYTVNSDKSVYVKGTATARSEFSIYNKPFTLNANTEYKFQSDILMIIQTTTGYISGAKGQTFTSESEISVLRVYIRIENGSSIDKTIYPMITLVGANDTYEPYTGGQPSPSPEFPQEIKTITDSLEITSCGKNLFNMNKTTYPKTSGGLTITTENGYFIINGTSTGTFSNITNAINFVISAGTYTISVDAPQNFNVVLKRLFPGGLMTDISIPANSLAKTFTTGIASNSYYFFISGLTPGMTIDNVKFKIQFERKDNATSIEDYIESQIQAKLPEGEFIGKLDDTYKDTLKVEYNEEDGEYHLKLYKRVEKVVLDGSDDETWMVSSLIVPGHKGFYTNIKNNMVQSIVGKCNYFQYKTYSEWEELVQAEFVENSYGTIGIRVKETLAPTIEEFKNWLSTHNTEVYYALAKLYTLDLGVVDMPLSYNEITNIFIDSDLLPQINVKYYRNFTKTIQNLQINNDTLKNELTSIENRLTALENANATAESEVSE